MNDPRLRRMFPLGSVLLPGAPLPLHIFEPRYQELLNQALEDDRTFGVVLISRGFEVGGGDSRTSVGTVAYIDDHRRFDDGRAAVACRGTDQLIEVVDWLPDDPFPVALTVDRAAAEFAGDEPERLDAARAALDALLSTAHDLGRIEAVPELEISPDPATAAWELAAVSPISTFDRQRVLEAVTVADRLEILRASLTDLAVDLRLMSELDER